MRAKKFGLLSLIVAACLLTGCTAEKSPSAGNSTVKAASAVPVEANWTLHVNETIPVEKDGVTVNYTLVLVADKQGGTDIYGTYSGNAHIKVEMDASKLSDEVIKMVGGFKMEASAEELKFEVIPHNADAYQEYYTYEPTDAVFPLKPVREYNGMALVSPNMKGAGSIDLQARGIQGEKLEKNESVTGTEAIPMRILVSDLDVLVEVPALKLTGYFKGQLTGEPVK